MGLREATISRARRWRISRGDILEAGIRRSKGGIMAREEGIAACQEMRGLWRLCWLVWLVAVAWMPVCCFENTRGSRLESLARFAVVRWRKGDGCCEARERDMGWHWRFE